MRDHKESLAMSRRSPDAPGTSPLGPRPAACAILAALLGALAPLGASEPADASGPPVTAPGPHPGAEEGAEILEPVIVTATRGEERLFGVPYSAYALERDRFARELAAKSLPDAIREVPGVMVQKTGPGMGSPYIRGFTGFRTLLLLDGIRLNNAVFREGPNQYWNTVDPLSLERIEVVKGPSSVLYGTDAIGGTVQAFTQERDPRSAGIATPWSGFESERRVYYRFASAEASHMGRAEIAGAWCRALGLAGGFSYTSSGDLASGDAGELPYTSYDEFYGNFKAIWRAAANLDVAAAYQGARLEDLPRTHATIYSKSFHGTAVGTDLQREFDQSRDLGYVQVRWSDPAACISKVTASLSYHLQGEDELRVRGDGRGTRQGFDDGTFGAWVQLESPLPAAALRYGAEYYRDDVDSYARQYAADGSLTFVSPRGPVADEASYDQVGVYAEAAVEPASWLELTVGGRFSYTSVRAHEVDPDPTALPDFGPVDESYRALVGSARALVRPLDEWNLFAGVSQGFRAPNLSDLTRFDVARSGEVETPSPDLDPERYLSFEVGTRVREPTSGLEASAAYYATLTEGMIIRYPTGDTIDGLPEVTKANAGDGYAHGVELGVSWNFWRGFTAFGAFAWIDGEVDAYTAPGVVRREPLSRLQPTMALIGLRWESEDRRFWVEGTVVMVDDQSRLSSEDARDVQRIPPGGTPGYAVCNLHGGVRPLEGLEVFAAVENLANKEYRVHGSGQNEPGTNAVLGLDWKF
ncbi:MAG: TonB-dependent receptor [Planctomycetota bacterium]